jgi:hypothetical protein
VPTGLPPCPSLRNQPCRPYVPLVNTSESPLVDPATDARRTPTGASATSSENDRNAANS